MTHAIRFHKTGGPEVLQWEEVEVGKPGPGEARVRNTAVGLNYFDTYFRSGLYPTTLPSGLGAEGAGVVEEVGPGVTDVKPGGPRRLWRRTDRRLFRGARDARRPAGRVAGRHQ